MWKCLCVIALRTIRVWEACKRIDKGSPETVGAQTKSWPRTLEQLLESDSPETVYQEYWSTPS
jgi:hypothetical protein